MKRSIDETAERFDEMSEAYDDARSAGAVAAADAVLARARAHLTGTERVVDIGTGTGILAVELAREAASVYALDISEGMRERAREKATEADLENLTVGYGTFRDPEAALDLPTADLVVSNFAMHHLSDEEKDDALGVVGDLLAPGGRFVLGDVVVFDEADVSVEHYDPEVDDPATVDRLEAAFADAGFTTESERVGPMAGVLEGQLRTD